MIHIYRTPAAKPVIPVISEYLKSSGLLSGNVCCVLPTGRNKRSLALRFNTSEKSPVILSIPEFNSFLFRTEKPVVPPELRHFFMRQAADRLSRDEKLALFKRTDPDFMENFITFAETGSAFFRFFREIKGELITAEELAKHALYTDYERQTRILHALWEAYTGILGANGLCDSSEMFDNPQFNQFFTDRFTDYVFLITGFLTRHEMRTLKTLSEKGSVHLFFHFIGDKTINHKEIEETLGTAVPDDEPAAPTGSIEVIETGSRMEEYEFITEKIYETAAKGVDFNRMAVILPDEKMKAYFIENDIYNLFNITAGTDGTYSEIYQTADIIRKAAEENLLSGGLIGIETMEKLTAQPFLKKITGFGSLAERIKDLIGMKRLAVTFDETAGFPSVRKVLTPFFKETHTTLTDAAKKLINLAEIFNENAEDQREKQHGTLVIKELKRLITVYAPVMDIFPLHTALTQLMGALARLGFHRPGGEVTVMGLLETRNMQFDAVFIPNMNADVFPPSSDKDLFLNTEIRCSLRLPTFLDREHLIKNYMSQIIAKSKFAYISCISRDKGSSYRSPFLEEIIIKRRLRVRPYSSSGFRIFSTTENGLRLYEQTSFKPDAGIAGKLKKRGISATMLNDYIACPYRFYAKYIIGLKPAERPEDSIPPYEYGKAIHSVLENIYSAGLPETAEELHGRIYSGFLEAIGKFDAYRVNPLEKEQAEDLAERLYLFAVNEINRFSEGWRPKTEEDELEAKINGMRLKGRLDRTDENGGKTAIIDYKLKTVKDFRDFKPEKIKDVQMPLYALLFMHKHGHMPDEILWYDLKKEFRTVKAFDVSRMDEFREFLEEMLKRLADPEQAYPRTDRQSDCRYCDYADLCGRS
ncbi:Dna2/Cas4 domain-containing protein [Geovibrio thiophilus]|uniref:Dna2/Cas4 domain-containing protein n=1 Tax=Geovibrio thiophilus TaxID=139438 RepID=A0A3R5V101_9BACT|nr:PD-(D/E)XK nuclease family protein [Geovibrio thiophilus]QAR32962.1 Dna2/Cas4 domain-containing protein [Geovibrio thiophilus]